MKNRIKNRLIDYSKLRFKLRKKMRYDDMGDYMENTIFSYDVKDPIIHNAVMLHEFIEYTLVKSAGIPVSMIDDFDTKDDAADKHPREYALYSRYHRMANHIEREFIENLGLDWKEHMKILEKTKVKTESKIKTETKRKLR